MEHSSFNREKAIHDYIGLIKDQGCLTSSDRDELTSHLHDSTEALLSQGLTEEESFMIACKRIGKVELLTEEYSKVNPSVKNNSVWASFLISYYNRISNINRYLLLMTGIGFMLETTVGISADLGRGDTYFTVYFVSALITGVALGRILGARFSLPSASYKV